MPPDNNNIFCKPVTFFTSSEFAGLDITGQCFVVSIKNIPSLPRATQVAEI